MLTRQLILWLEVSWPNRKPAENITTAATILNL